MSPRPGPAPASCATAAANLRRAAAACAAAAAGSTRTATSSSRACRWGGLCSRAAGGWPAAPPPCLQLLAACSHHSATARPCRPRAPIPIPSTPGPPATHPPTHHRTLWTSTCGACAARARSTPPWAAPLRSSSRRWTRSWRRRTAASGCGGFGRRWQCGGRERRTTGGLPSAARLPLCPRLLPDPSPTPCPTPGRVVQPVPLSPSLCAPLTPPSPLLNRTRSFTKSRWTCAASARWQSRWTATCQRCAGTQPWQAKQTALPG